MKIVISTKAYEFIREHDPMLLSMASRVRESIVKDKDSSFKVYTLELLFGMFSKFISGRLGKKIDFSESYKNIIKTDEKGYSVSELLEGINLAQCFWIYARGHNGDGELYTEHISEDDKKKLRFISNIIS